MSGSQAPAAGTGIVVGVDGSPLSVEALRWAARMAPVVGGPVRAVAAWHMPTSGLAFASYPGMDWDPEADAAKVLESSLEEAFGGGDRPAGLEARVVGGRPPKCSSMRAAVRPCWSWDRAASEGSWACSWAR